MKFKDLQSGEIFLDSQRNYCMKVDNLANPDYNAVYLNDGLITLCYDDEDVTKLGRLEIFINGCKRTTKGE